jgi:DNA-binding HxlR family transcriptional regulator/DNA-binding response OmpR family regulator
MTNGGRSDANVSDEKRYLSEAATLISKKWYPIIIQVLGDAGPMGFNDLQSQLDGISAKVLTDALEEQRDNGLVDRREISQRPLRVEYSLTPKGEDLRTAIQSLADWGERHLAEDAGPPTVLIADDERRLADMHAEWLDPEYDVEIAYEGKGALKALDADVDLVLLDRRMPGLTGDELVDWIRANHLDCRIVMLTSQDPGTDVLDLGFDEYLTKPVERSDVLAIVDAVLSRREYDARVREYLALRSKQALLRAELASEDRGEANEFEQLRGRIAELEAELDEIPDESGIADALRPIRPGEPT